MGTEIEQERFTPADHERFKLRLRDALTELEGVLARPGFGVGERTIGAELELFLIDGEGRPFPMNEQVRTAAHNPMITPELGAFSIELNTPPVALRGLSFGALRTHMKEAIDAIDEQARARGGRVVPISILPTFRAEDFSEQSITDRPRYRALAAGLRRLRKGPFKIRIEGPEPLELTSNSVAIEGANLAFQMHLRTAPDEFARMFNAAMMLTAPVLAASGNSPTFLGHRLWAETRVALFQQAGDDRPPENGSDWRPPGRTGFGSGWVREGAAELFRESVALYEPILPVCSESTKHNGRPPELPELRLHHGTVWKWNRPVYDPHDDGHIRIELRALPSGPTLDDMLANAAALIGCMLAFAPEMDELLPSFPFALAERNFDRAAELGLEAELAWPQLGAPPEPIRAGDLLLRILPRAAAALREAGVADEEVDHYLGVFEARVRSGMTGAVWQSRALVALERHGLTRAAALRDMLEHYVAQVQSGRPVAAFDDPDRLKPIERERGDA